MDVQGGRGVYVRAQRGLLPPRASDTLAVRNRAIDGKGLSPSRFAALSAATETDDLIREIQADYEFIRQKLVVRGFESLTGSDGKWIQARTKGAGHGSTSRAFYARTRLVKKIFEMADATGTLSQKLAA